MLHIGWRQIYEGYDMVLVGKIKEALEGENIDYKVEADNPARSRMSRDVAFGGNPLIINNIGVDTSANAYSVYVPKEKKEFAEAVVHGINRED